MQLKIKKINENAVIPTYGTTYSAGADLYACTSGDVTIEAHATEFIHTGLCMEIPVGYVGLIYARSGLACKRGLAPANKVGVIDSDYRGEIIVALHNHTDEPKTIEQGERVAQIVITPFLHVDYVVADELEDTQRGDGGFGSTGKK